MRIRVVWLASVLVVLAGAASGVRAQSVVRPGDVWLDNRGKPIQAHGGGILRVGGTYFWFGEDRSADNAPGTEAVACYSSKDLVHWTFRRRVLTLTDPEKLGATILERPKVFFHRKTKTFVMYMHIDGPDANGKRYGLARVGVAVSKTVDGEYKFVRSFRPLGEESRDIGQFIDDDGTAYLIFESRPTGGFFIAKLSDDYMSVAEKTSFVHQKLEGGAIVHYKGLYYVLGSHLTGWAPNPNVYATATSLSGPWTEFKDVAPPEVNTYDSQSSMLVKVGGTKATTVIYVGDRWKPENLPDSRYIWMPVEIGDGAMRLPKPEPWTLDVKTGVSAIVGAGGK